MAVTDAMIERAKQAQEAFYAAPIGAEKHALEQAMDDARRVVADALTAADWIRVRTALPYLYSSTPRFLHYPYDRAGYEAMAAELGVRAWDDAEIARSSYAVKFMSPDAHDVRKQTEFALAHCRLMEMEGFRWSEEHQAPARPSVTLPPTPPRVIRTCPICGQIGTPGAYPFSTGYADNRCDDCG